MRIIGGLEMVVGKIEGYLEKLKIVFSLVNTYLL